jgi:predicted SprT family Zn-dependent metalloprotease
MILTTKEAEIYCRMELKSHGLKDHSIVWREWPRTLGEAWGPEKQIHLSSVCLKNKELLIEVVKHEIAHILDYKERKTFLRNGRNDFHGANWKKWCKIVRVRPRRFIPT